MNIKIETNRENCKNELEETVRAFSPYLALSEEGERVSADLFITDKVVKTNVSCVSFPELVREYAVPGDLSDLLLKRHLKRFLKRDLYDYLSMITGVSLSYGS